VSAVAAAPAAAVRTESPTDIVFGHLLLRVARERHAPTLGCIIGVLKRQTRRLC